MSKPLDIFIFFCRNVDEIQEEIDENQSFDDDDDDEDDDDDDDDEEDGDDDDDDDNDIDDEDDGDGDDEANDEEEMPPMKVRQLVFVAQPSPKSLSLWHNLVLSLSLCGTT